MAHPRFVVLSLPALVVFLALGSVACSDSSESGGTSVPVETAAIETSTVVTSAVETSAVVTSAVTTAATGAVGTGSEPPAADSGAGVLTSLENGDRACYVVLRTPTGERSLPGAFELCAGQANDATGLIGKEVSYRTEKANVIAESCEGNPDCTESDEVDLVVELLAADGAASEGPDDGVDNDKVKSIFIGAAAE